MLQTPLPDQDCIREYDRAQRALFTMSQCSETDALLLYSYEIDFHNFKTLLSSLDERLDAADRRGAISADLKFFMEILKEKIFAPVVRDFHQNLQRGGWQGELGWLFAACEEYYITLHDFLAFAKRSRATLEDKILTYGTQKNASAFSAMLDNAEKNSMIMIENEIRPDQCLFRLSCGNHRHRFLEAAADEALFSEILTPAMRYLYENYSD